MNKHEFEYNYYYEMYKEKSVFCHRKFKKLFKEKHPNAKIDIDKLVIDIERYQIKRFGIIKYSDSFINLVDPVDVGKQSSCRRYHRFGNKEEREKRNRARREKEL